MIIKSNQIKIGFINVWSNTDYRVGLVLHMRKQKEIMEKTKPLSSTESVKEVRSRSNGQSSGCSVIFVNENENGQKRKNKEFVNEN